MKRKVFPLFFNLPVRITAPYVDIINVQDFDNKFAKSKPNNFAMALMTQAVRYYQIGTKRLDLTGTWFWDFVDVILKSW